jgi:hypothetical protein
MDAGQECGLYPQRSDLSLCGPFPEQTRVNSSFTVGSMYKTRRVFAKDRQGVMTFFLRKNGGFLIYV